MFVSVVRNGNAAIYECKSVYVQHDNEEQVTLSMKNPDVNLVLKKVTAQVFVMNNEGKTIDRYRWS